MRVRSQGRALSLLLGMLGAALFVAPQAVSAASFTFTPASGSFSTGDSISVQVGIDPSGTSVNTAEGTLSFDSSLLSVSGISKDGSAFSLWTADPSFSNSAGTVDFSGGTPTAFSNKKVILTINFTAKAAGTASVAVSKGSILAADGKGTDVYQSGGSASFTIADAAPAADTSSADTSGDTSGNPPPLSPVISSQTDPDPTAWYGTSTAEFDWQLPPDATGVRTLISQSASDTPKTALKSATTTQTVTGIADGVWYFLAQIKNDAGWGDIGSYKVQIDTTPPNEFTIALQQPGADGGPPKLVFKTDDALSGMDHYEIILGSSSPLIVSASSVTDGTYAVPPQGGGDTQVTINAFDKAGNERSEVQELTLPAVAKPAPASGSDTTTTAPASSGFGLAGILAVLFALSTGGVIAWNMYSRRQTDREKSLLLQALAEVRDKNDRIFSAMREEFEQIINDLDPKPQLTPQERDLLENLKEVLDLSEELVDTSIEDIKKQVKNH